MSVKAKYIKDLPLKNVLDGSESLLVQDSNGTKQAPLEVIVDEIKQNSQEKIREIESDLTQTNAQLSHKANKNDISNVQQQLDNLVLGAVGDGNNAEVLQARGNHSTLNGRLSNIEESKADVLVAISNKYADISKPVDESVLKANTSCSFNKNGELVNLDGEDWWCVSDYIELPEKGYIEISCAANINSVGLVEYDFNKEIISTTKPNLESSPFAVLQNKRISRENSNTCYVRILGNFNSSQTYRRESACKIFEKSLTDYVNENIFTESSTHLLTTNLYANRDVLEYHVGKRLNTDGNLMSDAEWYTSDFIEVNKDIEITGFGFGVDRPTVVLYDRNKVKTKVYYGTDKVVHPQYSFYKTTVQLKSNDCSYVRIVGSAKHGLESKVLTYLNNAEVISKIYATELFLYDKFENDDVFYTNEKSRLNVDGTLKVDYDWETSDFIEVNETLKVVGNAYGTERVAIAMYDDEYNACGYYYGDTLVDGEFYKKEVMVEPSQCRYVRLVSSKKYNLKSSAKYDKNILDTIKDLKSNGSSSKLEYTRDTIYFTVNVNQNFADNTGITTNTQDSEVFKPVSCALMLPLNYSAQGKPTKIAVVMHGAGGQVTSSSAGEMNGFTDLLNNGYAIFDVNGSNDDYVDHSDHMGGPRVLSAYLKAYDWIKEHYNVEEKLYVHGHSMGGLTALNFAIQNPSICKVLGLYHPVTDMYNQAWIKPWFGTTKQSMAVEYNFNDKSGATYEPDKIVGFNPIENHSIVIGDKRYNSFPCPIKIWHGDADTTVLLSDSQKLIDAFKNAGVRCELRVLTGVAHVHTDAMYKELTMWFNRF